MDKAVAVLFELSDPEWVAPYLTQLDIDVTKRSASEAAMELFKNIRLVIPVASIWMTVYFSATMPPSRNVLVSSIVPSSLMSSISSTSSGDTLMHSVEDLDWLLTIQVLRVRDMMQEKWLAFLLTGKNHSCLGRVVKSPLNHSPIIHHLVGRYCHPLPKLYLTLSNKPEKVSIFGPEGVLENL